MMSEVLWPPPPTLPGRVTTVKLSEGTVLYRVHDRNYHGDAFNERVEDTHFRGTRFGGTRDDPYPVLYAARHPDTALLETLLHDSAFESRGVRTLLHDEVSKYKFTTLRLNADVELTSLRGAEALGAVAATNWLTDCTKESYGLSRRWARFIRQQVPTSQGLAWSSKRDDGREAVALFGDRFREPHAVRARVDYVAVVSLAGAPSIDFGEDDGIRWLNKRLHRYRAVVLDPGS